MLMFRGYFAPPPPKVALISVIIIERSSDRRSNRLEDYLSLKKEALLDEAQIG